MSFSSIATVLVFLFIKRDVDVALNFHSVANTDVYLYVKNYTCGDKFNFNRQVFCRMKSNSKFLLVNEVFLHEISDPNQYIQLARNMSSLLATDSIGVRLSKRNLLVTYMDELKDFNNKFSAYLITDCLKYV